MLGALRPGCVWDVTFLANGDLATACADYSARLFTHAADRAAPEAVQQGFQAQVAAARPSEGRPARL